jgi:drug/metabolite transporter (DMT)-like permease
MEEIRKSEDLVFNKDTLLPMAALIAAVILWGSTFVGTRIALKSLEPSVILWIRMMTALLILLPFSKKIVPKKYIRGDWKLLIPMVLFQPCLYFLLESNALRFTTSSQAGVIAASVPILVTLGAWLFLSESITRLTVLGLMLSIAGVFILTMSQGGDSQAENPVLGNSMEFLAMICAAANILIIKKLSDRYNALTLTAMQIIAGSIFFLPGFVTLINMDSSVWTLRLIMLLLYMGAFVSLGAFALYNWAMSRISASKASSYINLVPVSAIIFGWMILGEKLNTTQSLAAIVVLAGVLLGQKKSSQL